MAGPAFFDDFDFYADQAALEASPWDPVDSKANGILDATNNLGVKSMLCQQTPVETRPARSLGTAAGRLDLWFYDDGADIKAFDVTINTTTSSVALGLRDAQAGTATNYTYRLDGGSALDTGIARSAGWHLMQFALNSSTGTEMRIDGQAWAGNTLGTMDMASTVTVTTNLGNVSDANSVWIDTVKWTDGDAAADLPADARMNLVESFESGIAAWSPQAGTNTALTYITDDGANGSANCMDAFDGAGGTRGYEATLTGKVKLNGKYKLGFEYMNGPDFAPHSPWPDLTVSLNESSSVNVGSSQVNAFTYGQTATAIDLTTASPLLLQVSGNGNSSLANTFCRFDQFYLVISEFAVPTAAASNWQLY